MLIGLTYYYHEHLPVLSMGLFYFICIVLVGNLGGATVLPMKPPHSLNLKHLSDFGCGGPVWMRVWRWQGRGAGESEHGDLPVGRAAIVGVGHG